jgi:predicted component of type VI protein secretion system
MVMDDAPHPAEAAGLPVQGPHRPPAGKADHNSAFIPLRLVLKPGGAYVEFTRPDMLVGRHTDADVRLALPDVSRRHCRMVFAHGGWQMFDLNSLNGVFVNGQRVEQATLRDGDQLRIGGLTFVVQTGPRADAAVPITARDVATRASVLRSIVESLPVGENEARPPQRKAS